MNLLDRVSKHGTYKKAGNYGEGEWQGPCPLCGGTDRFHVFPNQGDHGTVWCRSCDLKGDAIEYLMKVEGLAFRDAAKEVGKEISDEDTTHNAPRFKKPKGDEAFQPRSVTTPAEKWTEHAQKLVEWSHLQLLGNPDQLAWLSARGLDRKAVESYRLGWNPGEKEKDLYRARESWGLETVLKDNGKPKKLWIPIGLTIPCFQGDNLHRVRIRRPEGDPRYYLLPGSGTAPLFLGRDRKAFVIVESELDALLIHHLAGDLVGVISNGNSTAKPDSDCNIALISAMAVLIALDSDDAGMNASVWWKKQYPQAERWPVPIGKDPGDAYKAGVDIREWVKAGLPPALTLPRPAKPPAAPLRQDSPISGAVVTSPSPGEGTKPEPVHTITARDGREINITDNPDEYSRLAQEGKIVFTGREIALIKSSGLTSDQTSIFLDVKQAFPGQKIERMEQLQEHV